MKNLVILIGNVGNDIELKHFEGGGCVGRLSLATSFSYVSTKTNEKVTETEWHSVVIRNKQAETLQKYVKKGDKLSIDGRLKTRKYTDGQGVERYTTEIICESFVFLTSHSQTNTAAAPAQAAAPAAGTGTAPATQSSTPAYNEFQNNAEDPDDLPF
jgi:single-strand DNA-binding protein